MKGVAERPAREVADGKGQHDQGCHLFHGLLGLVHQLIQAEQALPAEARSCWRVVDE